MIGRAVASASCLAWLGTLGACLFIAGCGQKPTGAQDEGEANMRRMMRLLTKHQQTHMGRLPTNDDDLKKWAKTLKKEDLDLLQITDLEAVYISPRDKKPYVVNYKVSDPTRYSATKKKDAKTGKQILVHEQDGSGGKRYVALSQGGSIELMPDAEFKEHAP